MRTRRPAAAGLFLCLLIALATPTVAGAQQPTPAGAFTVAGVEIQMPATVPPRYRIVETGRFGNANIPGLDVFAVQYRDADDRSLRYLQGWPIPFDDEAYDTAPDEDKGETTTDSHPARWLRGERTRFGLADPGGPDQVLSLRWRTGELTPAGEPVGYALEAEALTLDDLLAIAHTVRPLSTGEGPAITIPTGPGPMPRPAPNTTPPEVWAFAPTLGEVPDEQYLGRITVEFGGAVIFPSRMMQPLAARAVEALEMTADPPPTPPIWPADRAISAGPDSTVPFRGRVVIELWERTIRVAVTAPHFAAPSLLQEATVILRQFRAPPGG